MSYTALYRKWRPVSFEDVKGTDWPCLPVLRYKRNR